MWKALVLGFTGALGAGLGAMVFLEVQGAAGWGSGRIVKLAARLLPETMRSEREEEWLAEYARWNNAAVGRLLWSLGLLAASMRIARRERRSVPQSTPQPQPAAMAMPPTRLLPSVKPRDLLILGFAIDGMTYIEIARTLGVTARVARRQVHDVMAKLDAPTLAQAVERAEREGLYVPRQR